jgi:carbamoyltransferase
LPKKRKPLEKTPTKHAAKVKQQTVQVAGTYEQGKHKTVIILGISDSHESHACIVRDGKLLAAMAEERLSRLKADMGYPLHSINSVLKITGIAPEEIDIVAFAGRMGTPFQRLYKMNATFGVGDWIEQNRKFWGPKLLNGANLGPWDDFELFRHKGGDEMEQDPYFCFLERAKNVEPAEYSELFRTIREEVVLDHLGVAAENIHQYRHEDCHKIYGYYSAPGKRERAAVLTMEGGGDDSSATVSLMDNGRMDEIWRSNEVQIGRLYRYVTLILGMKPAQHEYKVMGLAPYSTEYHGHRSLEFFRTLNSVMGTEIHDNKVVKDLYYSVRDALEGERFDGIAWGLQTWVEEILCDWINNICTTFETDNIVFSGGVAQNIKACKALMELPAVSRFWAGPISGDGSLGIGAAWIAAREFEPEGEIEGLTSVYLGTEISKGDIDAAIERHQLQKSFRLIENPNSEMVADLLEAGQVVARCSGRMEFGQRALGNRSILADPRRTQSLERINQKIKYRDFWMPFTPSMMVEESDRLIHNPKSVHSPYMTMAFDLKPEHRDLIPAAMHPSDKTVRPQMLLREDNPSYYDVMSAFRDRTGVGAVLNTSFNLHGDAIVESADDAINTFLKSELDVLLFDDIAVSRVDD